jgi:Ca2+-binding RTX toxin-like protein
MRKQDFNYVPNRIYNIQKGSLITRSIPLALLLLLVGMGAVGVLLPTPSVSADTNIENNDDFDHTEDTDNGERKVTTTGSIAATVNTLPTTHGDNTITGNNDGDEIPGTNNDDTIIGTFLNDRILGRDGDDTLNGAYGSDTIEGNDGADTVQGAELDDQLYGNKGNDVISGGPGNDYLSGGDDTNELYGDDGDDTLRGGDGKDYFSCGTGFDVVLEYDKSQGDVYTMDCEVINSV